MINEKEETVNTWNSWKAFKKVWICELYRLPTVLYTISPFDSLHGLHQSTSIKFWLTTWINSNHNTEIHVGIVNVSTVILAESSSFQRSARTRDKVAEFEESRSRTYLLNSSNKNPGQTAAVPLTGTPGRSEIVRQILSEAELHLNVFQVGVRGGILHPKVTECATHFWAKTSSLSAS